MARASSLGLRQRLARVAEANGLDLSLPHDRATAFAELCIDLLVSAPRGSLRQAAQMPRRAPPYRAACALADRAIRPHGGAL